MESGNKSKFKQELKKWLSLICECKYQKAPYFRVRGVFPAYSALLFVQRFFKLGRDYMRKQQL